VAHVLRALLFLIGMSVVGVVLFVMAFRLPHAWMPLLMGSCMTILLAQSRWTPKGMLLAAQGLTWVSGCFTVWLVSTSAKLPRLESKLLLSLCALSGASLLASLIIPFFLVNRERKVAIWLTLVLLSGLFVAFASGSAGRLDLIAETLRNLGLDGDSLRFAALAVRKVGHFTMYGLIGWFGARAALAAGERKPSAAVFGLLTVLFLGGFDEIRQSTSPSRFGSPWDLAIDLAGAATFIGLTRATKGVRSR
jgi:hypothetical protein